ncbi:methylenetetrahydrofolate reductase [Sphingorhabdus sp. M41]|uniref:methylenetetrahydrofolate reductase n=1 Tax=Sphingorhabdus sp. M41 TaxID=1806885 RepID=UPI00078C9C04|nr:methylenetetrahydrofolate reductase [Sphingorhabdus sp. M41]AMO71252.1 5,10-methylenetetrahydrofolate reductase [Sphingorhabdus sp. M41]
MSKHPIHPNWERAPVGVTEGYSLEITAKDIDSLRDAAPLIAADTPVAVTFLPGEEQAARVAAAVAVRALGFEPMPHFSARRISSSDEFEDYLQAVVRNAGVQRCFLVAGDPPEPEGPYFDSSALIESGAFERAGIKAIGIGGHPEGHPVMSKEQCWEVIDKKIAAIESRGMAPLIVTQFGFDPDIVLAWLEELRSRGVEAPVRIGIPGPAGIKRLLRYAKYCGVGASASVLAKYGISLTRLMGSAGPDKLVDRFSAELGSEHGRVRLHFYPFGGIDKTVEWIADYNRRHDI